MQHGKRARYKKKKHKPLTRCIPDRNLDGVNRTHRTTATNEDTMDEGKKIERMMKELQSDLSDLVASGDLTENEANEWANMKADQWARGIG